jgi:positive regulator of sigma E activity
MIEDVWVLVVSLLCFIIGFLIRGELQRFRKRKEEVQPK